MLVKKVLLETNETTGPAYAASILATRAIKRIRHITQNGIQSLKSYNLNIYDTSIKVFDYGPIIDNKSLMSKPIYNKLANIDLLLTFGRRDESDLYIAGITEPYLGLISQTNIGQKIVVPIVEKIGNRWVTREDFDSMEQTLTHEIRHAIDDDHESLAGTLLADRGHRDISIEDAVRDNYYKTKTELNAYVAEYTRIAEKAVQSLVSTKNKSMLSYVLDDSQHLLSYIMYNYPGTRLENMLKTATAKKDEYYDIIMHNIDRICDDLRDRYSYAY